MYPQVVQFETRRLHMERELQFAPVRVVADTEEGRPMNASKTTSRIAIVLGTFAAFVAIASAAQASSTKPAGMTQAEYAAVLVRSEALNTQYGNAVMRLSPAQFAALWKARGDRLEPQELLALMTRSEGLNHMYHRLIAVGPQGAAATHSR